MISLVNMKELVWTVGLMYDKLSKYEGIGLDSRGNVW